MARPARNAPVDLSQRAALTVGLIERLSCPTDTKGQAFLRDSEAPGLRVRVTNTGAKSFVFEGKLNRQTIRRTIGDVRSWTIEQARAEARRLAVMLDAGMDPREVDKRRAEERLARAAADQAMAEAQKAAQVTVREVWDAYLEARKDHWGATHYNDHVKLARAGGQVARRGTRGTGLTVDMPLFPLMGLPLRALDAATVEAWAAKEAKTRPTSARLAWRLLKVFLNWCAEQPQYAGLVQSTNAAGTRKTREVLGRPKVKTDALLREQLAAWFAGVRAIQNPTISAAIQVMLLTGARPNEVLSMRWEDVNTKWRGLTIRDKVEGERVIPLTPYVLSLLQALPRRNEWVFASTRAVSMDEQNARRRARRAEASGAQPQAGGVVVASASGYISEPRDPHARACAVAGIDGLTLHGLRRSFKSLTEWLEIPAGVVAQIMGHKPSATAEKHYTVRPLDLLRIHHERIEAWILEQANMPAANPPAVPRLALNDGGRHYA
ncbi:integrase family protein [uncultured Pseudacidovorax sp.]|uniref:tyrosine-type recombinase/integrase n=1 Tax=uncultured Pseudacidovorax sp. TaxID=679313 RepID=UPI0025EB8857|nr:integrase family protein [uncultured Pseudacidovorax sp.]